MDAVQADAATPKFESFISASPQVRATIQASPYGTKADDLSGEDAERAAAAEDAAEDDGSTDRSDTSESTDESETSSGTSSSTSGEEGQDDSAADDSDEGSDDVSASSSSGSIVDTLISDMSEMNDHPLKNVNMKYGFARGPGYVQAGVDSQGANYMLPWFVQFEGEGNGASQTRIEMRNLRVFVKSRSSGEWTRLIDSDSFSGIQCDQYSNYYHCPQQASVSEDGEAASSLPLSNLNLHGWWGGREPINKGDLGAIIVALDARLIPDRDGVDDRSKAKYLINVGADFYPENAPPSYGIPAVGVSRAKLVSSEWQTFSFTTLKDVGLQEPGGGISSKELRDNPPPM